MIHFLRIASLVLIFNVFLLGNAQQKGKSCILNHPLIVIDPQPIQGRLLQSTTPHGLNMKGDYTALQLWDDKNVIQIIKRLFVIAKAYFRATIKVYGLTRAQSIYSSTGKCSNIGNSVPLQYFTGFDAQKYDMVIFLEIQSNSSSSYVAAAAPCILKRWPLYGFIVFNSVYIDVDIRKTGTFHRNVQVVMHQMMHILALNPAYYNSSYFKAFNNTNRRSYSQVIKSINGRSTIITPSVKAYVQSYFSCADSNVGGLLEDQGGSGTESAHWERQVYLDQLMTGSVWSSGLRISMLTLNLLVDSGFYFEIDFNNAYEMYFGKGDGCQFARGNLNPTPQFCTGNSFECDFYSTYGGYCNNSSFSNGQKVIAPTRNQICTIPQQGIASFAGEQFGGTSKCFNTKTGSSNIPHCFVATCNQGNTVITVNINGQSYQCTQSSGNISVGGSTIVCPSSPTQISTFCSYKGCPNFCDQIGVCLNGKCIIADMSEIQQIYQIASLQTTAIIVGIAVPVSIILIIILIVVCICCRRKNTQHNPNYQDPVIVNNTDPVYINNMDPYNPYVNRYANPYAKQSDSHNVIPSSQNLYLEPQRYF